MEANLLANRKVEGSPTPWDFPDRDRSNLMDALGPAIVGEYISAKPRFCQPNFREGLPGSEWHVERTGVLPPRV